MSVVMLSVIRVKIVVLSVDMQHNDIHYNNKNETISITTFDTEYCYTYTEYHLR
jgi:hypothetical protein